MTLDHLAVAQATKGAVIAEEATRNKKCCLCDGPIGIGEWVVILKIRNKRHPAHTHCAADKGWTIK